MMRSSNSPIILVILLFALNMLPACAQTTKDTKLSEAVTMDMKDINIQTAIEAMFRNSGRNFAVDPNVEGMIPSVSFKDVPFDIALKNLLKSSGLIYRIDHNVYIISKRPETTLLMGEGPALEPTPDTEVEESTVRVEKITLNYASPREILDLMTNSSRDYGGSYGMGFGGYGGGNGGGYGGGGYGGLGGSSRGFGGYGGGYNQGNYGNYNQTSIYGGSGRSNGRYRSW